MKSVFESKDYKAYINDLFRARPSRGRGERAKLAEALRCHTAYISQVLNGDSHFSMEQAEAANGHLGHSREEAEFFLLLVLHGRAGSTALRTRVGAQINNIIERRLILKNRLEYRKTLREEDQAIYYSSWHYTAVHFALMIPGLRERNRLASYLSISRRKLDEVLSFLVRCGLAVKNGDKYTTGESSIHLGSDSAMIDKHHTNWRLQAIRSLDSERPDELHYSSVITITKSDAVVIKSALIEAIEKVRGIVKPSPEENLFCYALDLFEIGRKLE